MRPALTRSARGLAVAAALLVTLTACGGDDDSASSATPTPSDSSSTTPSGTATPTSASPSPADTRPCPVTATEVPLPAGYSTDLTKRPKVLKPATPVPDGITYSDIVKGKGNKVVVGSNVEVKYVGALFGTAAEFDSSWKTSATQTLPFQACYQGVVPGFSVGPIGMQEGGRRIIEFPAKYGYGQTAQASIPAGSALIFIVDAVKVS